MKTIQYLFLVLGLMLIGCSEENEEDSKIEVNLNPPEWIIGEWEEESSSSPDSRWLFTVNNAIWKSGDYDIKDRAEYEATYPGIEKASDVLREEITNNSYKITLYYSGDSYGGVDRFVWFFEKISETEMVWRNGPGYEDYKFIKQ